VANDPCGDLDPQLTREISCLATMQLADRAKRHGIKRRQAEYFDDTFDTLFMVVTFPVKKWNGAS
jgi:hypothetical protein